MYDLSGLGTRIRLLRMEKGYTQEGFAKELGVSAQAVSKWETGAGYPDIGSLPLIADVLDTNIDALFGGEMPVPPEEAAETPEARQEEHPSDRLESAPEEDALREDPASSWFAEEQEDEIFHQIEDVVDGALKSDEISLQIESAVDDALKSLDSLKSLDFSGLKDLGGAISRQVDQALRHMDGRSPVDSDGGLLWNGTDIDSLVLSISGNADVRVLCGTPGQWSVSAGGSAEFLSGLRCTEDGNVLRVESPSRRFGKSGFFRDAHNTITICTGFSRGAELDLTLRGSGDFRCEPAFASSHISSYGSGDMELTDAGNLTCLVNGSGDVSFAAASNLDLTLRGSGDADAGSIQGTCTLKIQGSGDAAFGSAAGQFSCQIFGAGDLEIGSAALTQCEISSFGAGDVSISGGSVDRLRLNLRGAGDFDGRDITVGDLEARLSGAADAVIGRLTGRSAEQVGPTAGLKILQRG